jgi:hypothetical protein
MTILGDRSSTRSPVDDMEAMVADTAGPLGAKRSHLIVPRWLRGTVLAMTLAAWVAVPTLAEEMKPGSEKTRGAAPGTTPAPKAQLAAVETPLRVEVTSAPFRLRLRLEVPGKDEVKGVTVDVPDLLDSSGKAVSVKCEFQGKPCGSGLSMSGFSSAFVDLSADLPSPGEYTTWVRLAFPGGADTRQLIVSRKPKSTATFSIPGVEQGVDGVLWLTVADTAGVTSTLRIPAVAALNRNQPNRPKVQASFEKLVVSTEDGQQLSDTFDVRADTSRRIKLEFQGLESGSFEGKLILGSADSGRQELTVSLSKRLWIGYAFVAILAGVLVSHFLRYWASSRRPLLEKRRDLVAVRERFETLAFELDVKDTVERRVVATVRWALEEPEQELLEGTMPADFDNMLGRLKRQIEILPAWILARRRVQVLEPAGLRDQLRTPLDSGQAYLLARRAAANDDQVVASLAGLDASISSAVRAERRAQLKALRSDVDDYIKTTPNPAFATRLRTQVRPRIDTAESQNENDNLTAGEALNDARVEYAKALAADLAAALVGPPAAPFAADKTTDEWVQLRRHVTELLKDVEAVPSSEARQAIEAYEIAYRDYIAGLVGKAKKLSEDQEKIAGTIKDATRKSEMVSRLSALRGMLDSVNQKARDRLPRDAGREWGQAWAEYEAIDKVVAAATGGQTLGGATAGTATSAVNTGGLLSPDVVDRLEPAPEPLADRARGERMRIRSYMSLGDWIFTGAVAMIAVGLGLKVLWIDNPAWGSYDDWLIALLWGLGLHQGSAGAFEGLSGLKAKFTR